MDVAIVIVTVIICVTVNSIHKRNKTAEVVKEAIKQGHSVDVSL